MRRTASIRKTSFSTVSLIVSSSQSIQPNAAMFAA